MIPLGPMLKEDLRGCGSVDIDPLGERVVVLSRWERLRLWVEGLGWR